jgi:hypothetical protein
VTGPVNCDYTEIMTSVLTIRTFWNYTICREISYHLTLITESKWGRELPQMAQNGLPGAAWHGGMGTAVWGAGAQVPQQPFISLHTVFLLSQE